MDPTIQDTGLGGTSQGAYDLKLNFRPQVDTSIIDTTGVALDGDLDGIAGGVHNFWFQTRPLDRMIEIIGDDTTFTDGQTITITESNGTTTRTFEFDKSTPASSNPANIRVPIVAGADEAAIAVALQTAIDALPSLTATVSGNVITLVSGDRNVQLGTGVIGIDVHGKTIFVDKSAPTSGQDGSLDAPFNNIARTGQVNAFANAHPDDIIRIVGNGGLDRNLSTEADSQAYELGFGGPGNNTLSDGATMSVPQGVTVMIDAGAVFKLRDARIGVGSSTASVDRSVSSIQVLGTPKRSVFFTSYNDEQLGIDTNSIPTSPLAGDWGGISIRQDVDRGQGRFLYEQEGIFLNYVNHADIRYGGGDVVVDGTPRTITSINIADARPTISFNRVANGADAAISADPNSFAETKFNTPRFQLSGVFTSDYDRVGPDFYGNRLVGNSTNALFVRIETLSNDSLTPLRVAGRFDDTDITHVIGESVLIQGTPGGPIFGELAPPSNLISARSRAGGALAAGTYSYKVSYVDLDGNETPASAVTINNLTINPGPGPIVNLNSMVSVRAATQLALPPSVYTAMGSGVGDTLTASFNGALPTIDGVALLVGDAVLVKNEVNPARNGIYRVSVRGDGATPWRLTRDIFNDQDAEQSSRLVTIVSGTFNQGRSFVNTTAGAITFGTTPINWAHFGETIVLSSLPPVSSPFVARRLYRSEPSGGGNYTFVAQLDGATTSYVDDGTTAGGLLATPGSLSRPRLDARLAIDPGTIVKLQSARIEVGVGAQFIAEGFDGQEVILTSIKDDRYGAGGTFDTNNNGTADLPAPGDWAGIYVSHRQCEHRPNSAHIRGRIVDDRGFVGGIQCH